MDGPEHCSVDWQLQSLSQREFPLVGLSLWLSAVLYGVALSKNTWGIIFQENPQNHCCLYLGLCTFNNNVFWKLIWQTEMPQTIIYENNSVLQVILVLMSFGILYPPFIHLFDYNKPH